MSHNIAVVGGTGPEGRGLATRFALAGHTVAIGSRDAARGDQVARELLDGLGGRGQIVGGGNEEVVASANIVVVTVPYDGHRLTLEGLRQRLAGKIVVDAVVPVRFERGPRPVDVEAGSATEEAAAILEESLVVGAFHNLGAKALLDASSPVDSDVLVTGNDAEAKQVVMALADEIAGVRAVDAGPLRFSRFVEGLTTLLIGINIRHKAHTAVRITGLDAHE
ncbi:MAG: NADPH-dependent F420 reductase [Dehalococcoidia bacterium]|nr:NADPH-dependent F420 reductase [Dehalococcoidia bacterium]